MGKSRGRNQKDNHQASLLSQRIEQLDSPMKSARVLTCVSSPPIIISLVGPLVDQPAAEPRNAPRPSRAAWWRHFVIPARLAVEGASGSGGHLRLRTVALQRTVREWFRVPGRSRGTRRLDADGGTHRHGGGSQHEQQLTTTTPAPRGRRRPQLLHGAFSRLALARKRV